jgi:ATP-binding cassette subfamily B (MDR/TAP) protein 1
LRQEVAYFDRSENSSGSICTRLSSDASAIQQMAGTRLGAMCETVALIFFGFLFGIWFNWQLTMIVFIPLLIIGVVFYLDINLQQWLNQHSRIILDRASTV